MSQIDNKAKSVIKKADGWIARNLVRIASFILRYGVAFALGAYVF